MDPVIRNKMIACNIFLKPLPLLFNDNMKETEVTAKNYMEHV